MTGDSFAQIAYLVLLGLAVGGYVVVNYRGRLGKAAQHAALWGLIFLGVLAGVGLWDDIRTTVAPVQRVEDGRIEIPRAPDGHYYATTEVNGTPTRFMVDTGATDVVLDHDAAEAAGIDLDGLRYLGQASTANGTVRIAPVLLDSLTLGPVTDEGVRAWVSEGEMPISLMGMSYLQNFSRIEIEGGAMILSR